MKSHHCVWIDHRQAKVFALSADSAETTVFTAAHGDEHLHRKADHVGLGKLDIDHAMLEKVAGALRQSRAILLTGPGQARTLLAGYLNEHHPAIAARIWDITPADHPSDEQAIASARRYFAAADRMHA
jgi:hypothetical protein